MMSELLVQNASSSQDTVWQRNTPKAQDEASAGYGEPPARAGGGATWAAANQLQNSLAQILKAKLRSFKRLPQTRNIQLYSMLSSMSHRLCLTPAYSRRSHACILTQAMYTAHCEEHPNPE